MNVGIAFFLIVIVQGAIGWACSYINNTVLRVFVCIVLAAIPGLIVCELSRRYRENQGTAS